MKKVIIGVSIFLIVVISAIKINITSGDNANLSLENVKALAESSETYDNYYNKTSASRKKSEEISIDKNGIKTKVSKDEEVYTTYCSYHSKRACHGSLNGRH